jgi:hypothetical protein
MKVICGYLDPIVCPYPVSVQLASRADYINYIDSSKNSLGLSLIERTYEDRVYGLTNDGLFYVQCDWEQGEQIQNQLHILESLNKYILLPFQLSFGFHPFKRIQIKDLWPGAKDAQGIVSRHLISQKTPTGSLEIDRFNERDEIQALLNQGQFSSLHMFYQIRIDKAYPHTNFRKVDQVEKVLDDYHANHTSFTNSWFSLLNQYFSEARYGLVREAFYTGIMLLEELYYEEISTHKFAFDRTRIKKKLTAKSLNETTFRNKISILRHNQLYDVKSLKKEIDRVAQVRNDVFHRGYVPTSSELFQLDEVIVYFLKRFKNQDAPRLAMFIQHI